MIYLIRHAESVGNAGGKTVNSKTNPLTEEGIRQSVDLLSKIPEKPDLIVVSPYFRAQQTADPLIKKYPDVPVETWNVQEFTFLDVEAYEDTTHDERILIREEYLSQNNSDFVHGTGAESFNQMLQRVDDMLHKLRTIEKKKFVVIFTHGHFMRAVLARKERQIVTFDDIFEGMEINNTDIIKLK
jgi:broad specificity phosphatase PhoE